MTSINSNQIEVFLKHTYHRDKLTLDDAKDLGIKVNKFNEADADADGELTVDEIEDSDLKEFMASIILEEPEKEEAIDKEHEKDEENKVKDKNGAGF